MSAIPKYSGQDRKELQKMLRDSGFRSTEGRLALIAALKHSHKPIPVAGLAQRLGARLDEVNIYRALESFAKAGIARRVDLQHGHTHYELNDNTRDHHHMVCTSCSKVEDFEGCDYEKLAQKVLKRVTGFSRIESHSFELFGLCNTCVKQL
jgi:Fur family ferric uptake transcriptional regulator